MSANCTRVRNKEIRKINERYFDVFAIDRMEYSGKWEPSGYELWDSDGKYIHTFIGWPTDSDILEIVISEQSKKQS